MKVMVSESAPADSSAFLATQAPEHTSLNHQLAIHGRASKLYVTPSKTSLSIQFALELPVLLPSEPPIPRRARPRGLDKGITMVVFDRGGLRYEGRVKAPARSARATRLGGAVELGGGQVCAVLGI